MIDPRRLNGDDDLFVLVQTLLNRVERGSIIDIHELDREIRIVIGSAGLLCGTDLVSASSVDVASSLLVLGNRAGALRKVKNLLILRGR
ncbi:MULTISPECIES: hypothetical protein [Burkholderiaceae]|uniref:hypothetical protein n=1 Tax=Burkholderiaceae TaxID=119060 RepID=UPI000784F052|nr:MULTISPECIES: hypothetical protein [Burkholderiaceae]